MQEPDDSKTSAKTLKAQARTEKENRLKAALKANMGRRKIQARARAADEIDSSDNEKMNE